MFHLLAGEVDRTQVDEHEMVIRTAADKVKPALYQLVCKRLCIFDDILLVGFKRGFERFAQRDAFGGDNMHKRPALGTGEHGLVDHLGVFFLAQNQPCLLYTSISAGDEVIGELISEAMEKVSANGVITVEESKTAETYSEVVEGMQFDRGYITPYMVTDSEKMEAVIDDAYILITDKKISNIQDIPVSYTHLTCVRPAGQCSGRPEKQGSF